MDKTIKEWFEGIEDPDVRKRALENMTPSKELYENLNMAIMCGIHWRSSPEKEYWWKNIHEIAMEKGNIPVGDYPLKEDSVKSDETDYLNKSEANRLNLSESIKQLENGEVVKLDKAIEEEKVEEIEKSCNWTRSFDYHYNLSCANETNERGNYEFNNKWKFIYCPYCGGKIDFFYPSDD